MKTIAMKGLGAYGEQRKPAARVLASRGDLTAFLMALTADVRGDFYMLLSIQHDTDSSDIRIVASNWIYDAIHLIGYAVLAALAECPQAATIGSRADPIVARDAPALHGIADGEQLRMIDVLGHAEIYPLRLNIGRTRLFLLMSSTERNVIDVEALGRAHLECCYALSHSPDSIIATSALAPLSERERECLFWVSEGKTTEEIAVILGVAANTVNSYVTHAIQKLGAANRTMAVAVAIRSGII